MALPVVEFPPPASRHFRFRFVARGETANALAGLAIRSLKRCHPNAAVVLVDANDTPELDAGQLGRDVCIVHRPPDDDAVAGALGRGSPGHLFYWRHSPQLRDALPPTDRFDVHCDADILFVRPMDLASLLGPLAGGRIAVAIDESSLKFYRELGAAAATDAQTLLPRAGAAAPLLQGGLLFRNPADDGGLYDRLWQHATEAAERGFLARLPWNDMCLLTSLLGHGGPLWERLLVLGHDWNFISDARKDPGVFGCAAHFGGRNAQPFILAQRERLFPAGASDAEPWGTVVMPASGEALGAIVRGPWPRQAARAASLERGLRLPFALSWQVPVGTVAFDATAVLHGASPPPDATFFVYIDGKLVDRHPARDGCVRLSASLGHAETVTLIAVSAGAGCEASLDLRFA